MMKSIKNVHGYKLSVLLAIALLFVISVAPSRVFAQVDGHPVVISFGDSYSSGEGTEDFYGHEYLKTGEYEKLYDVNGDFLPHRSEKAWPGQLVVNGVTLNAIKDNGWYFFATSGAVTDTILKKDSDGKIEKEFGMHFPWKKEKLSPEIEQFESIQGINPNDIDYVTLTMGGNDVGFVDAVVSSIANGVIDANVNWNNPIGRLRVEINGGTWLSTGLLSVKLLSSINKFNTTIRYRLTDTYRTIDNICGETENIIVAGYPHLFPYEGSRVDAGILKLAKWAGISADDASLVNESVDVFDEGIQKSISEAGLRNLHFVDVRGVFESSDFGTAKCINPVFLFTKDQDIKQGGLVSAYSVHPTEYGQQAYAQAVQQKINYIEDNKAKVLATTSTKTSNVAISIVMDVSGSMDDPSAFGSQSKLESAKQQSIGFVNGSIHESGDLTTGLSTKVGVCSFSTTASTVCGLADNAAYVTDAINGLQAYGRTNMYAGLAEGIQQLEGQDGAKIMMFLSDGLSNEGRSSSSVVELAHEAADKGITIYTIGYGSSGDLDEDLLREIAEVTGGSYAHEDSSNAQSAAVGLFATMMEAQLKETQQLLLSQTGSVSQGNTVQAGSLSVNSYGTLTCYLYWPGSTLDIRLVDPDGVEVSDGYVGYSIDDSSIPTKVTIDGAKQGQWEMSVYGREVSMDQEPFYAAAAFAESDEPQVEVAAGGASTDNSTILLLLFALLLIGGFVVVYALAVRRR